MSRRTADVPRIRILVADDDQVVRGLVGLWLRQEQWQVEFARHGREALDLLRAGHFDAAVLDVRMPHLSGNDVLQAARQEGIHVPVVILTAYATVGLAVQSLKLGACDFLTKPATRQDLITTI